MATKEIKTRIALRTGDFAYWTTGAGKDIELIKGEVCVCTVAAADNQATTAPTVLFKVCDTTGKKFADLKWMSGLAADVYTWAKATEAEHKEWLKTNHADLDTRYSFSTDGDKLVVKKTLYTNGVAGTEEDVGTYEFLTAEEVAKTLEGYYTKNEVDGLIAGVVGNKDTDTKDSNTIAGAKKYTDAAVEGIVSGSGYATQTWVTGEIEKLDKADVAVDGQYVSAVSEENGIITVTRANLPTSADYGVLDVSGDAESGVVVDKTDGQRPTIKIAANTYDAHGAAAAVLGESTDGAAANTVYGAKAAAAAAQNDATIAKTKIETFLGTVTPDGSQDIIDTLTEINSYVGEHVEEFAALSGKVTNIENGTIVVPKATDADTLDGHDSTYFATSVQGGKADTALQEVKVLGATLNQESNELTVDAAKTALGLKDAAYETIANIQAGVIGTPEDDVTANTIHGVLNLVLEVEENLIGDADDTAASDSIAGAKKYADSLADNYATFAQGTKADNALQEVEVGEGLKVSAKADNKQKIEIDEEVIFVLDCNW